MWAAAEQRAGQTLDGRMDTYVRTQASCQQLQRNVVMLNTKSCTKKTHVDIITAQRSAHFTYADEDVGLHPDLHSFSFLSSLGFIISLFVLLVACSLIYLWIQLFVKKINTFYSRCDVDRVAVKSSPPPDDRPPAHRGCEKNPAEFEPSTRIL